MSSGKVVEAFDDFFSVDKYRLEIQSIHTHWEGSDLEKIEDMPGDSFSTKVFLKTIANPDLMESLALEKRVHKLEEYKRREITREPKGYVKLLHDARMDEAKNRNPQYYREKIRIALKEIL